MSLTKKIKWFSVTFLLTISTCSLADEIVQLGWGGNYDELSNQKKYLINEFSYHLNDIVDLISKEESNPRSNQEKVKYILYLKNLTLNAFEEREQESTLVKEYNNILEEAKKIIGSINYFSIYDRKRFAFDESDFVKQYDFDNQRYYIFGSKDPDKSLEEYAIRSRHASDQYNTLDNIGSRDYFCQSTNVFNASPIAIRVSIPSCKNAYFDFPSDMVKKILFSEGHYSKETYTPRGEYYIKIVFTLKSNKVVLSSRLDTTLDKAIVQIVWSISEQYDPITGTSKEGREEVLYETPLKFED